VAVADSTPAARVLIAEDDRAVRESLERALRLAGYAVVQAKDGLEALEVIERDRPDVAVVDVMMPHLDGFGVCRRLRDRGDKIPVLLLTARDAVEDRVAGLDAGADDYLPKPFALEELLARVRVMVRRQLEGGDADGEQLVVDDLVLDPAGHTATRGGEPIELTRTEFALLELLMRNEGIVLSRDVLYERIWGWDFETSSKTLDVYIGYVRRKTEQGGRPRLLHTVRGVGYTVRAS
jgi:two-component system response regulator MprA